MMKPEEESWDALRSSAQLGHTSQGAVVEAMRRLHSAIQAQTASADTLGKRIACLNVWLLVFTVAIFLLTAVLVGKELLR